MTSINATFLLLLMAAAFLLLQSDAETSPKNIVLTNNHTNYLSIRCFSFNNEFDVKHLPPWGQFQFTVRMSTIYPSSTMFNCSTNMGTFVAFRYNYECSMGNYDTCEWRFDENNAYRWEPKSNIWVLADYAPNYESLDRGGVIKGYFAN